MPDYVHKNNEMGENPEKNQIIGQLSGLEYKIIWELENWKKAEEEKFKVMLKQREIEYLKKLNEEWKVKEIEKEKAFRQSQSSLEKLELGMKRKAGELAKREEKLVLVEEELKQRIIETAKELGKKDEHLLQEKSRFKKDFERLEKELVSAK